MKIPDPTLAGNLRGDYLGARMLAARQKSGLNKKDAAERIGIAVATLSRIERGTTGMVSDPSTITRAAKLYAVSDVWLYAGGASRKPVDASLVQRFEAGRRHPVSNVERVST